MARDLTVNRTAVDSDKYVYREERDLSKTQVDWGTVSKNLTDTINTIRDNRQTEKDEIETANTEAMERAAEFDQYNNKTLNESVLEGSEWAREALSIQMDLTRRGLVTPSERKRYEQRVSDSFTSLKKNVDSFSKDFDESTRRANAKESTTLEQAINGSVAGLGVLKTWQLSGNTATGELAYVRAGNDPATGKPYDLNNPSNQASLGTIGVRVTSRVNYTSTTEAAQAEVEHLAEIIDETLLTNQAVKSVEDWRKLENSKGMMEGMVNSLTATPAQIASIAQDRLSFTSEAYNQDWTDEQLAADPDKVRLIPDPMGSGDLIADFSPEQIIRIKKAAELSLESQIDQKIKFTKGFDADSPAKAAVRKEQQSSFGYIDQTMGVITGDNAEFNSSVSSLKTAWDKDNPDNPMAEEAPIDRSTDPNFILVNYANGEVEKIAKFKLDENGNQILGDDKKPIPVSDRLLVQGLLTKVAPVTGSTETLMDEYIKENPGGLKDRGKRDKKTSYQGTGDKVIEDTQLGSKMILVEGSPMNVGDRFLAISKQEGSDEEQLAEYTTVINSILSSEFKDITADFEVVSKDITTGVGNRNSITVTIEGVPTEIEFDTVGDPAKLQSSLQKAINAAKKKIRDKRSKSSTSNNSGGKVR